MARFTIIKKINEGSFGSVYLGEDTKNPLEDVAIKLPHPNNLDHVRWLTEISNLKELRKVPGVLKYISQYMNLDGRVGLVTEYCQNGDVFRQVKLRGRYSEQEARILFEQLINCLDVVHNKHFIVHRDIKLENLLLDSNNCLKLADWGFSVRWSQQDKLSDSCGSIHYASPELILGNYYFGPEVDIWSCGVCLYALVSGALPFHSPDRVLLRESISNGVYRRRPEFSDVLFDLIQKMLCVDSFKRITIAEIKKHPWLRQTVPNRLISNVKTSNTARRSDDLAQEIENALVKVPSLHRSMEKENIQKQVKEENKQLKLQLQQLQQEKEKELQLSQKQQYQQQEQEQQQEQKEQSENHLESLLEEVSQLKPEKKNTIKKFWTTLRFNIKKQTPRKGSYL